MRVAKHRRRKEFVEVNGARIYLPKYQHQKSTDRAFTERDGKRIYFGRYGTKEAKHRYEAFCKELVRLAETGQAAPLPLLPQQAPSTIGGLVLAYYTACVKSPVKYVKSGKPTSERDVIRSALSWLLKPPYKDLHPRQFTVGMLEAVRDQMAASGKLCCSTVNRYMGKIPPMFEWALKHKWVPASVWHELLSVDRLTPGRLADPDVVPCVPDEIVEATLPFLPAVVQDMVRFQRLTGCRPAEVCIVRPCDVERPTASGATLPTPEVSSTWWYRPHEHKTQHKSKDRRVALGRRCQEILAPYLDRPADAYCFSPRGDAPAPRPCLQMELFGRPDDLETRGRRKRGRHGGPRYTTNSYRRAIHDACELAFGCPVELRRNSLRPKPPRRLKAEWERQSEEKQAELQAAWQRALDERKKRAVAWREEHCWAPNQLRHTFATTAAMATDDLEGIQHQLGHSELRTTVRYIDKRIRQSAKASELVSTLERRSLPRYA